MTNEYMISFKHSSTLELFLTRFEPLIGNPFHWTCEKDQALILDYRNGTKIYNYILEYYPNKEITRYLARKENFYMKKIDIITYHHLETTFQFLEL